MDLSPFCRPESLIWALAAAGRRVDREMSRYAVRRDLFVRN